MSVRVESDQNNPTVMARMSSPTVYASQSRSNNLLGMASQGVIWFFLSLRKIFRKKNGCLQFAGLLEKDVAWFYAQWGVTSDN